MSSEPLQLSLAIADSSTPELDDELEIVAATPLPPTAEQDAAIRARDRDIFLEAGAGTGKTRVLVDRYCDAIDFDGVEPERVLAFTFTEKAAAEMRRRARIELARRAEAAAEAGASERSERLLAASRAGEGAPITTIHGFCRRLLGAHPVAAGLDPRFRVLDAQEAARVAAGAYQRALEQLAGEDPRVAEVAAGYRLRLRGLIRAAYDDLRSHGIEAPELPALQITAFDGDGKEGPEPAELEAAASAYGAISALVVAFGAAYQTSKAERSGVDFDDLQLLALELLRANAAIGADYRARFDHILVDEFQDTSPLQIALVEALRGPTTRVFTVGDEAQSIYAFRGADLASFRAERERIRGADETAVMGLSGSFRSDPDIVAAVNEIGAGLLEDFRPLRVGRAPGGPPAGAPGPVVELLLTQRKGWEQEELKLPTAATETAANRIAEARNLALRLRELADRGVPAGSMVLLLRAFTHVDAYAEALELAGLDPHVVGGRGYWSAQQVEDALRLLACVANPLDDEALLGALASPAAGIGPDALWMLRRIAGRRRHIWPAVVELAGDDRGSAEGEAAGERAESVEEEAGIEEEVGAAEIERRAEARLWSDRLPEGDRRRLVEFALRLRSLRRHGASLPLEVLVERTLECFDYDLAALAMPDGRRRTANLLKLIGIAAEFEAHEGRDLRAFLTYARDRAAASDRESEAGAAADGHPGVRVMTIHAAKGLEFDCVAVADLGRGLSASGMPPDLRLSFEESGLERSVAPRIGLRLSRAGAGSLSVAGYKELSDAAAAAEANESGRLVYVAASRARHRLLLSGAFDPPDVEGGRPERKPSHSALARLLPALGVTGHRAPMRRDPGAAGPRGPRSAPRTHPDRHPLQPPRAERGGPAANRPPRRGRIRSGQRGRSPAAARARRAGRQRRPHPLLRGACGVRALRVQVPDRASPRPRRPLAPRGRPGRWQRAGERRRPDRRRADGARPGRPWAPRLERSQPLGATGQRADLSGAR